MIIRLHCCFIGISDKIVRKLIYLLFHQFHCFFLGIDDSSQCLYAA